MSTLLRCAATMAASSAVCACSLVHQYRTFCGIRVQTRSGRTCTCHSSVLHHAGSATVTCIFTVPTFKNFPASTAGSPAAKPRTEPAYCGNSSLVRSLIMVIGCARYKPAIVYASSADTWRQRRMSAVSAFWSFNLGIDDPKLASWAANYSYQTY